MRILTLTGLPRPPHSGQRLRVDHSRLMGLDSGLDPGEQVVLRVRDRHQLATVVHVDFGLDETTYDLMVNRTVETDELAALGAHETARRTWEVEDVMATMCRLKRTEIGCEETCSSCALNPDSAAGSTLQRHLSALD